MPFQIVLQEKSNSNRLKRIQPKVPKECKTMIQIRGCAHTIPRMHLDAYWPLESKHLPSKESRERHHTLHSQRLYNTHFVLISRDLHRHWELLQKLVSLELPAEGGGGQFSPVGSCCVVTQIMVNLIPYNPTAASTTTGGFEAPAHQRVERLLDEKFWSMTFLRKPHKHV